MNDVHSYTHLTISGIVEETANFKTFVFENGHGLSYRSGQFLTLVDKSGISELRRSYSICSSPAINEPLAIAVKRIDNGFFSRKLADLAGKGDILLCSGVAGFFCLPENIQPYKKNIFFCRGQWHNTGSFLNKNSVTCSPLCIRSSHIQQSFH